MLLALLDCRLELLALLDCRLELLALLDCSVKLLDGLLDCQYWCKIQFGPREKIGPVGQNLTGKSGPGSRKDDPTLGLIFAMKFGPLGHTPPFG